MGEEFVPNETNDPVDVIILCPRSHARVWNWLVTVVAATFWFAVRRTQRTAKREALLVGLLTALAIGGL